MAVQDLRRKVLSKCKSVEVLLALTYQLTRERKQKIETIRRDAPVATAKKLRDMRDLLDEELNFVRSQVKCKVKPSVLNKIFGDLPLSATENAYLPKWFIDSILFANFHSVHPRWKLYPPHALVAFDFSGELGRSKNHEYYLPEIALYEDMCLAYNLAAKSDKDRYSASATKTQLKTHMMLVRTAVLSAFYFVEAYLNAIAIGFWFKKSEQLSRNDTEKLLEWSLERKCPQPLGFKEKILRYQKIILEVQHPPLTESTCHELRVLLTDGKRFRDSIVHQSPQLDPFTVRAEKQMTMFKLRLSDAAMIVDAAVGFVGKFNHLLGKEGQRIDWLFDRLDSGLFPDKAFD